MVNLNYRTYRAHRLSYMIAHNLEYIENNLCVLHKCDNPSCVNPHHLWIGTNADNVRDRHKKGRSNAPTGEKHGASKLTEKDVDSIRNLYAGKKISQKALSEIFDVSRSTIGHIVYGRTWRKQL